MKPKNYGKDISSVKTPVRFHLPDGSSQRFNNSTEAQQWFNQNYGNGYSMVEYVPTQGDSEHPIELGEVVVTAPAPKKFTPSKKGIDIWAGANYSPSFNKYFYGTSDFDALFGKSRVEGVRKAWQRNPQAMQNWTDGGNAAAAFITAPLAAYAAGEYVLPWLAQNAPYLSARGWLGATQAVGNTPAWLTPTTATAIDATLAGGATGASINDMRQNGPTVGNVLGITLGLGGLAYEAVPTVREGAQLAKRIYDNGTLWDKYTTLGGRFGYYGKTPMSRFVGTVQRRFNFGSPAPRMPELIRAEKHGINFHPEEGIKERFPWINTTTTQPVISHPQGNWNGSDVIIYDPNMIEDPRRYLSIDPMDTFITGKLIPNKGQATVVSGNPNVLRQAKAVGYETVSSPRLRKLYPILQDKNANRLGIPLKLKIKMQPVERTQEALDYMNEIQRLISRRGLPTLRDYQYQSLQTGLPLPNFNPNLSQINLRGRSFASPLRFDTSPSTESNFKIRIGMNRNGTWPDHSPDILDDKGLQEAARNPNYDVNSFQNNPFEGFFNSENMFSK